MVRAAGTAHGWAPAATHQHQYRCRPAPPCPTGGGGAEGAGAAPAAGVSEHLLAACRFYDRECAGYLEDEDLEEIAYMVSDSLSSECTDGVQRGRCLQQ